MESIFSKWANDINGLSQLMEHHSMFNTRQEALSIDMSKVLKANKSRQEEEPKRPRKDDKPFPKKEDPKKRIESKYQGRGRLCSSSVFEVKLRRLRIYGQVNRIWEAFLGE